MKYIIDVEDEMSVSPALNALMTVRQQNPNQKMGSSITVPQAGRRYAVTRNMESYTVEDA